MMRLSPKRRALTKAVRTDRSITVVAILPSFLLPLNNYRISEPLLEVNRFHKLSTIFQTRKNITKRSRVIATENEIRPIRIPSIRSQTI